MTEALIPYDARWLTPQYPERTDRLVYDGQCGLCHRAVQFVLRHEQTDVPFVFTPLESEHVDREIPRNVSRDELPDSLLVITETDELHVKSDAVLYIGRRLGGIWGALARIAERLVPRTVRDTLYDLIAAIRHRLFEKPENACPRLPQGLRERFEY